MVFLHHGWHVAGGARAPGAPRDGAGPAGPRPAPGRVLLRRQGPDPGPGARRALAAAPGPADAAHVRGAGVRRDGLELADRGRAAGQPAGRLAALRLALGRAGRSRGRLPAPPPRTRVPAGPGARAPVGDPPL